MILRPDKTTLVHVRTSSVMWSAKQVLASTPWPNSDVTAFVSTEELVGTHLMTNSGLPRFLLSSPEMKALRGFSDRLLSVCKGVFSCSNEGPHLFPRGGSVRNSANTKTKF